MLCQLLHDVANGGTHLHVSAGQWQYLVHILAIRVRIFAAGQRSVFIHGAVVIGTKERARRDIQNVIAFAVEMKILIDELRFGQSHSFGQTANIHVAEDWARRFAAIGAGQAVHFAESLLVLAVKSGVQCSAVDLL